MRVTAEAIRLMKLIEGLPCMAGYGCVHRSAESTYGWLYVSRVSFVPADTKPPVRIIVTWHMEYSDRFQYYINHRCVTRKNIVEELMRIITIQRMGLGA